MAAAKPRPFHVTLVSPDGVHRRDVEMLAVDEDHARQIAELQALELAEQQARDGGVTDEVGMRVAVQKSVYTVDAIEQV